MNRDEILNMPAGREMDALVAEKVMGWKIGNTSEKIGEEILVWRTGDGIDFTVHAYINCWSPSTDIAAAWDVVEKSKGCALENRKIYQFDGWDCEIAFDGFTYAAQADTAPLAICRAALLAVMEVSDEPLS